jgi:hypothetical protein
MTNESWLVHFIFWHQCFVGITNYQHKCQWIANPRQKKFQQRISIGKSINKVNGRKNKVYSPKEYSINVFQLSGAEVLLFRIWLAYKVSILLANYKGNKRIHASLIIAFNLLF